MQVQFEGDPASALVTYANPMEADTAFNAPDAVLGNRDELYCFFPEN